MTVPKKNAYVSLAVGIALLALILFLLIVGYAQIKAAQKRAKEAKAGAAIYVLVDVPFPLQYVERVGGAAIEIITGPLEESTLAEPKTRASLAAAKVVFAVADGPDLDDVKSLSQNAKFVYWIDENGPEGSPEPGFVTDVESRRAVVRKIADALSQAAPDSAPYFEENAQKLLEELGASQEENAEAISETSSEETSKESSEAPEP